MNVVWKLFDGLLIGTIQAFIFTLLTILYFDVAMTTDHGDHKEELLQRWKRRRTLCSRAWPPSKPKISYKRRRITNADK